MIRKAAAAGIALMLCVGAVACGGSDESPPLPEQRAANVSKLEEGLKGLPYIFEFRGSDSEPGVVAGRATSTTGAVVDFALSMGPNPIDVLARYPHAYDKGSIYSGRDLGMFYIWKNYPKKDYSDRQLNAFYDLHSDISNVACQQLFGKDCQI